MTSRPICTWEASRKLHEIWLLLSHHRSWEIAWNVTWALGVSLNPLPADPNVWANLRTTNFILGHSGTRIVTIPSWQMENLRLHKQVAGPSFNSYQPGSTVWLSCRNSFWSVWDTGQGACWKCQFSRPSEFVKNHCKEFWYVLEFRTLSEAVSGCVQGQDDELPGSEAVAQPLSPQVMLRP